MEIYNDSKHSISIETLYNIGGYITYNVIVVSDGFSGHCHFCVSEEDTRIIKEKLSNMLDSLQGELIIEDTESDSVMKLKFENVNQFYISGQIGGSHEKNMLKFMFRADQTLLIGMRKAIISFG